MSLFDQLSAEQLPSSGILPDRPPGMTGDDLPLYRLWSAFPPASRQHTFYNVRVGPPQGELTDLEQPDAYLAAQLLSLRIDALVVADGIWTVIEFHRSAGLAQLGRAIAYPTLLRKTYATDEPIRSVVAAYVINPFLVDLFHSYGVALWRAPTPPGWGPFEIL